jgi:dTDP-4-dehydrorhamnose reductase
MMRIAVTGAQGQLGAALVHEFAAAHEVAAFGHRDLDITDDGAVARAMERLRPHAIVNAAAYNDVDGAEDHPLDALDLNAFGVRALARAAERCGAAFVHYSTDFVFSGAASQPMTEDDPPNPQSVYAASKLLGEWFAADVERCYVLRVESLFGRAPGGPAPKGSIGGMRARLLAGDEVRAYEDRTVSPTYVCDAAAATRVLLERAAATGLYHCVNTGACTWLEFARELARQLGVDGRLVPIKMEDVTLRAQRPKYCALANGKLAAAGAAMPTWQDALARCLASAERD